MSGLRFCVCVVLSIALMTFDHSMPFFQRFRSHLSVIVLPIQYAVNAPIQWTHSLVSRVTTQHQLLSDNARLRAHELLLESRLQKLLALERENAQLRELLKSAQYVGGNRVLVAQLLALDLDPLVKRIILDKGKKDKVYAGQPVLDAYGVMGQIVQVAPFTSKLMLVTDSKSAVPVQDYRNGFRAMAVGIGESNTLDLVDVPDTADIKVGDLFVSSGLGLRYPVGYPVGVVSSVTHVPGQRFAKIELSPSAHLDQTQQVLLVWPDHVGLRETVKKEFMSQPNKE